MVTQPHDPQPIDWQAIRASLDWDSSQQAVYLLRQRASQYAAPLKQDNAEAQAAALTVLAFALGDEQYAVDVMTVQAVRPLLRMTPVPGAPAFYRGVVNVRGQMVSVLDLRRFFNLQPTALGDDGRELMLVQANGLTMALLTSRISGVTTLLPGQIQPMEHIRYVRGVTAERLIVLDIQALFSDDALIIGKFESE